MRVNFAQAFTDFEDTANDFIGDDKAWEVSPDSEVIARSIMVGVMGLRALIVCVRDLGREVVSSLDTVAERLRMLTVEIVD